MIRIGILAAFLTVLGGCGREPTFDERYDDTASQIHERANTIDRELDRSGNGSRQQTAGNESDVP